MSLLEHEENILREYNAFSIHRQPLLDEFWSEEEFTNPRINPTIQTWSQVNRLLTRLWNHLPFGQDLTALEYDFLVDSTLNHIKDEAREQLFYWHTAGALASRTPDGPVQDICLLHNPDYLWFHHIAPIQQHLKQRIVEGQDRTRFLDQFYLDFDKIVLTFKEIRVFPTRFGSIPVPIQTPYRLVICPGRTHTFRWNTNFWETNLENPDHSLTNPTDYELPPTAPNTDEFREARFRRSRNETPAPVISITPPPLLERIITPPGWGTADSRWESNTTLDTDTGFTACWCGIDVCTCGHRPATPPTPPYITLWTPGDRHLPS